MSSERQLLATATKIHGFMAGLVTGGGDYRGDHLPNKDIAPKTVSRNIATLRTFDAACYAEACPCLVDAAAADVVGKLMEIVSAGALCGAMPDGQAFSIHARYEYLRDQAPTVEVNANRPVDPRDPLQDTLYILAAPLLHQLWTRINADCEGSHAFTASASIGSDVVIPSRIKIVARGTLLDLLATCAPSVAVRRAKAFLHADVTRG